MEYIDAHVHVWTDDLDTYPLAETYTKSDMQPETFYPEDILAHALPSGVNRIVLIQMSYYGFDNSYMLDVMEKRPDVFSGIAIIDGTAHTPMKTCNGLRGGESAASDSMSETKAR